VFDRAELTWGSQAGAAIRTFSWMGNRILGGGGGKGAESWQQSSEEPCLVRGRGRVNPGPSEPVPVPYLFRVCWGSGLVLGSRTLLGEKQGPPRVYGDHLELSSIMKGQPQRVPEGGYLGRLPRGGGMVWGGDTGWNGGLVGLRGSPSQLSSPPLWARGKKDW
jgi:hypothetical protein